MTVAELIAELQKLPQDAKVMRVVYDEWGHFGESVDEVLPPENSIKGGCVLVGKA